MSFIAASISALTSGESSVEDGAFSGWAFMEVLGGPEEVGHVNEPPTGRHLTVRRAKF
jgi:hypothetical protein